MRALPRERPAKLTAPPDGQVLEDIIGELQSTWGVPPYPQEYRITIKVAEERESRSDSTEGDSGKPNSGGGDRPDRQRAAQAPARTDGPRREKAPAAPGMAPSSGPQREKATRKKRRRRRRGGAGGGGENAAQGGSAGPIQAGGAPGNEADDAPPSTGDTTAEG